jgi:ATP-binding cassette, subfamily B, bacterial
MRGPSYDSESAVHAADRAVVPLYASRTIMRSSRVPSLDIKTFLSQLRYLPQALALVWTAARPWTMAWAVLLVLQGGLPVATVYLTRAVVNSLVAATGTAGGLMTLRPTLLLVGAMIGVLLLLEGLRSLAVWVRAMQAELVQDHLYALIHEKAITLDISFYDTPEYYDRLHRARVDAFNRPVMLLENIGAMLQHGLTLAAMATVLMTYTLWLPVVLLGSTLPALWVVTRYTVRFHRWRLRNTVNERRTRYYDWLLTWRDAAMELRLFALGRHYHRLFQELRGQLRSERLHLVRQQTLAEMGSGSLAVVVTGLAIVWMAWRATQGLASLGDVALFYQVFTQGQRLMRTLLENAGEVYRNILFLENLFEFLALESQVGEPSQPVRWPARVQQGMRFEEVTFRYPGSARPVLEHFSVEIPAGRMVALVGTNGAGKSTLIKLLCRFYDPDDGRITVDGIDLRSFSLTDLHRHITVLFQEPVRYHASAADNIALGDLAARPTRPAIEAVAEAAGAAVPIMRLPQQYETVLGKWFGGAELSVGEWQRIALARAFLRRASILILDEPTSAMDSWAEADWLTRFRRLAAGRTTIIITHRFTTAMQADYIYVMDNGHVIEAGTHSTLLALNGRYGQSWRTQVQQGVPDLPQSEDTHASGTASRK